MNTTTRLVLLILFALLFMLAGALYYFFRMAHVRKPLVLETMGHNSPIWQRYKKMMDDGCAWLKTQKTEDLFITSYDGLKLHGLYIPAENPKACVILFHGFRSSGPQDFGALLPFYNKSGFSTLLIDQRACGESEGKYITFGVKERQDALSWAQYIDQRFVGSLPIVLHGLSLGGATVMMSADLPFPKSVVGLISDCGFTSPYGIIAHCAKQWFKLPAFPMVDLLSATAKLFAGFGYKDCSTLDTLANSPLPLFLIHGAKDTFVPAYMSAKNAMAAKNCRGKLIVPEAGHATSYVMDTAHYEQELLAYLSGILQRDTPAL